MSGEANQHREIMAAAQRSLQDQRMGGRRRQMPIGRGSAQLRQQNLMKRIKLIVGSMAAIIVAAMITGIAIDGIGFTGIMVAFLAIVACTFLFSNFPKVRVPKRADLNTGDVRHMVARTELWLENQRPALPAPAVTLVDKIGTQLDALGLQLETVDPTHPAAQETRKLVGETLPGMVDAYRRIPSHLRREKNSGASPDEQIVESLGKISGEIDQVTRQLAAGALDDLAVRTRYLDYKYGDASEPTAETP
jgi:Mg2+/Co2+ transporter CorB